MKNDVQFRSKLLVEYLYKLVSLGEREQFDKYFPEAETYMKDRVYDKSCTKEELEKLHSIVDFRQNRKIIEM